MAAEFDYSGMPGLTEKAQMKGNKPVPSLASMFASDELNVQQFINRQKVILRSGSGFASCLNLLQNNKHNYYQIIGQILRENRGIVPTRPYAKLLDELFRLEALSADLLSDDNEPVRKRGKFQRRQTSEKERSDPRETKWYKKYVLDSSGNARDPTSHTGIEFRRRFRVPWSVFNLLLFNFR